MYLSYASMYGKNEPGVKLPSFYIDTVVERLHHEPADRISCLEWLRDQSLLVTPPNLCRMVELGQWQMLDWVCRNSTCYRGSAPIDLSKPLRDDHTG